MPVAHDSLEAVSDATSLWALKSPLGLTDPVAQSAEAVDLKSIQCGFESRPGHFS